MEQQNKTNNESSLPAEEKSLTVQDGCFNLLFYLQLQLKNNFFKFIHIT